MFDYWRVTSISRVDELMGVRVYADVASVIAWYGFQSKYVFRLQYCMNTLYVYVYYCKLMCVFLCSQLYIYLHPRRFFLSLSILTRQRERERERAVEDVGIHVAAFL